MAQRSLSHLKRKREQLQREGVLQGCWIEFSRPGGTAKGNHRYGKLRSRTAFENGCTSRYLKDEEIAVFQQLIDNGRELRKIEREIAWLETRKRKPREAKTSSVSDEWYTPPEYIELTRQVMGGIDLDPASNTTAQQWIQAERWYGIKNDGLKMHWDGRVWLNPPYGGGGMPQWIDKVIDAYENGAVTQAVVLVRPAAGTAWFQLLSSRFLCCALHKRIKFIDAEGQKSSPTHGNIFYYLGQNIERFSEVFRAIGVVSRPV